MTRPCDKLHPFADGELPIEEVPAFEQHLVACAACQEELKNVMLLEALGYGLTAEPAADAVPPDDRPRSPGPAGVVELSTRRH